MTVFAQAATFAPGWFVISPEQAKALAEAPGLRHDDRRNVWLAHHSHLPLLNVLAQPNQKRPLSSFGDGVTQLRPYQVEAVDFIRTRRGTLLADQQRVGKTPSIIASHDPDLGKLVVVAPLQTRYVWLSWMKRRWPDETPLVLTGRTYDPDRLADAKLIFIHYDVVSDWVSIGIRKRIGTLVFDEAHTLAHRKSRRSTAACEMSPVAERTICATGTPLWNAPESIYGVLRATNPGAWGTYWDFTKRYCGGHPGSHGWQTGDAINVEELQARLSEVMLRRIWSDVASDLPEVRRVTEQVSLSASQLRDLDMIAADLRSSTDEPTVIGELARYRGILALAKAPRAAEIAEQKAQAGPVVVWAWHRKASRAIYKVIKKFPCWIVDGSIPDAEDREALLDRWRAHNNGILIMSIAVGQAGIDLSHARQAVFAELDWTPAVIGQAEMRTFSPLRDSEIIYVVADHDIDERLAGVLVRKCEQALVMGTPAADTAIEVIGQILGAGSSITDLGGLAQRIANQVRDQGSTLE